MNDIETNLDALGFQKRPRGSLRRRELFATYYIELKPYQIKWECMRDGSELYVYIKSPLFGRFMERMFGASQFPYGEYRPRKLTHDKSGTLAMALVSVRCDSGISGLYSAAIHLSFGRIGTLLEQMTSAEGVFSAFYESEMGRFLDIVEDLWVFLYLAYERGLNNSEVLGKLTSPEFVVLTKSWHLRRPIDSQLLDASRHDYVAAIR